MLRRSSALTLWMTFLLTFREMLLTSQRLQHYENTKSCTTNWFNMLSIWLVYTKHTHSIVEGKTFILAIFIEDIWAFTLHSISFFFFFFKFCSPPKVLILCKVNNLTSWPCDALASHCCIGTIIGFALRFICI